jgi:hypothetical protein
MTVVKKDLAADEGRRETVEQLRRLEREEADHGVNCLKLHEERIEELERKMREEAEGESGLSG